MPNIKIAVFRGKPATEKTRLVPDPLHGMFRVGEICSVTEITEDMQIGLDRGLLQVTNDPANRPLVWETDIDMMAADPKYAEFDPQKRAEALSSYRKIISDQTTRQAALEASQMAEAAANQARAQAADQAAEELAALRQELAALREQIKHADPEPEPAPVPRAKPPKQTRTVVAKVKE